MISAPNLRPFATLIASIAAVGLTSACSSLDKASNVVAGVLEPYRMEVVQGNVVSREQVNALPQGASRAQVASVLGTPLLTSVFHADRWDYAFSLHQQGKPVRQRRVTVFFKGDRVERIDADDLPTESEFASSLRTSAQLPVGKPLQASAEVLAKFPPPAPKPVAPQLPPLRTDYPPLEP